MCLVSHIWQIDLKMIQFWKVPNCRSLVWVKNWAPLKIGQARHVKTTYAHFVWFPLNIYDPYPASFLPIVALIAGSVRVRPRFRSMRFSVSGSQIILAPEIHGKILVAERKSHGKKMEIWGSPVRWLYSAGQREIGLGGNSCYDVHSCQACLLLMILMEFFCDTWCSAHCFWYIFVWFVCSAHTHASVCLCVCVRTCMST